MNKGKVIAVATTAIISLTSLVGCGVPEAVDTECKLIKAENGFETYTVGDSTVLMRTVSGYAGNITIDLSDNVSQIGHDFRELVMNSPESLSYVVSTNEYGESKGMFEYTYDELWALTALSDYDIYNVLKGETVFMGKQNMLVED